MTVFQTETRAIQNQNYRLLELVRHLSLANLEISGTYDMGTHLQQFFTSCISSSHHSTLADVSLVFVARKLANLSLRQAPKLKESWNEYTPTFVDSFLSPRTTQSTISSLLTKLHTGHTLSCSRTSRQQPLKKSLWNILQRSKGNWHESQEASCRWRR